MSDGTHYGFLFRPLRGGWQRLQALTEGADGSRQVQRLTPSASCVGTSP
jgi:hypothetical protein